MSIAKTLGTALALADVDESKIEKIASHVWSDTLDLRSFITKRDFQREVIHAFITQVMPD